MKTFQKKKTPYDLRWVRDGLHVAPVPGYFISQEVDMTFVLKYCEKIRNETLQKLTPTHVLLRCIAEVASLNSQFRELITDNEILTYSSVDIAISIDAKSIIAPTYVIRNCETKSISDIALELELAKPKVIIQHTQYWEKVRKWGWIIPMRWGRRIFLRRLLSKASVIHQNVGIIQVSTLKDVDHFIPFLFSTPIIVSMGCIKKRVIVINDVIQTRSTAHLSICGNHKNWEGLKSSRFLSKLKEILETGNFQ
jgi:pyruvate/2-oxoglutarate dehydrogenase complex dihydrolipoamide acyltransferase (E2) component